MSDFRVGDKVKVDMPGGYCHGKIGTVEQPRSDGRHWVRFDACDSCGNDRRHYLGVEPRHLVHVHSKWIRRSYDWYFTAAVVACHAVAFAFDIWLVLHDYESISSRDWTLCEEHPTIQGAVVLGYTGLGVGCRRYRGVMFFLGVMCGHMGFHW